MRIYTLIRIIVVSGFLFSQVFGDNSFYSRSNKDRIFKAKKDESAKDFQTEQELKDFIEEIIQQSQVPGLSISVAKNQSIVWEAYFGHANIGSDILVDENTMFILSSISKTVTATALMQLYERGLFELNDDIDAYLPFEVNHPNYPSASISFKMLLTHTSGIKDNWGVMPYYNGDSDLELGYYLEQYLVPGGQFYGASTNFTSGIPGSNYSYSNIGAALIGLLVEEISGQEFSTYCKQQIFEPLGMENSSWFLSEIDNLDQVALPYVLQGGSGSTCFEIGCGVYDESNPCFCDSACMYYGDCCADYDDVCGEDGTGDSGIIPLAQDHYGYSDFPSGQLRSTSKDLAKFMAAIMNNGIFGGVRILESETVETIRTIYYPFISSTQGLIWYYKNEDGRNLFGHNGGDIGSLTEMFISFSDDLGVVVLSNSSSYNAVIEIERAVFSFAEQMNFSLFGDINLDGSIDILDVVVLVGMVLENDYSLESDTNQDGALDVLDIIIIVNIIIGENLKIED